MLSTIALDMQSDVYLCLAAVVSYLPSPLDVPPMKGSDVDDAEKALSRKPADEEPFSALAFKIMADQFVGSLTFLRIYRCVAYFGSYTEVIRDKRLFRLVSSIRI